MASARASAERKCLIVAPAWVGDTVMSQALLAQLLSDDPDLVIETVAPPATYDLFSRMAEVSASYLLDVRHGELGLARRYDVAKELRSRGYDRAIVLPNTFKSALVPFMARVPVRTGFRGEHRYGLLNDLRHLDSGRLPGMAMRFVSLARPDGEPLPEAIADPVLVADRENAANKRQALSLDDALPVLAVCPGAEYGAAKQWPVESYAHVARHAIARGWQVWIFGSPADEATGRAVQTAALEGEIASSTCHNLAGKTTLTDAIDLLSLTDFVVTNDSGLMHVAASLGRHLIAIFGSTSPLFTPPLSPKATVLTSTLPCSPCFERVCPLAHANCLKEITSERVIDCFDEYCQSSRTPIAP